MRLAAVSTVLGLVLISGALVAGSFVDENGTNRSASEVEAPEARTGSRNESSVSRQDVDAVLASPDRDAAHS